MGVEVEKHHHEVAPSQHELGVKFTTLVSSADGMQKYKYVVQNVAHSYGRPRPFMPKPIYKDNGSGMHVHQSIWKAGKPLFAGNGYADLSDMALYYIGGIIKHAKAINAFTNPTTNRLQAAGSRVTRRRCSSPTRRATAGIRPHPVLGQPEGQARSRSASRTRSANPYLAYAAMLMAGLDGITNKLHPGQAMDKNLYDLPPEELKEVPDRVRLAARSAHQPGRRPGVPEARRRLHRRPDRQLHSLSRWRRSSASRPTPHPIEFEMYYSA